MSAALVHRLVFAPHGSAWGFMVAISPNRTRSWKCQNIYDFTAVRLAVCVELWRGRPIWRREPAKPALLLAFSSRRALPGALESILTQNMLLIARHTPRSNTLLPLVNKFNETQYYAFPSYWPKRNKLPLPTKFPCLSPAMTHSIGCILRSSHAEGCFFQQILPSQLQLTGTTSSSVYGCVAVVSRKETPRDYFQCP